MNVIQGKITIFADVFQQQHIMKRIITFALTTVTALTCMAQNGWEVVSDNPQDQKKTEKATNQKISREESDKPYLKGAVPEVDGIITFTREFDVPGKSAQELYDIAYAFVDSMAVGEGQIKSRITLVNKGEHSFAARFNEWMVFSQSLLAVDRTEFHYSLVVICEDGHATVGINHLSYIYDRGKIYKKEDWSTVEMGEGLAYRAEEWISDKEAINKKGTKLLRFARKFRIKTVDRMNEIFDRLGTVFKQ